MTNEFLVNLCSANIISTSSLVVNQKITDFKITIKFVKI